MTTKVYVENITDLGFTADGRNPAEAAAQLREAAKLLLRRALADDFGISGEPSFTYGPHGKPYLIASDGDAPWFNISHSGEYVACVISKESEVGIDIQRVVPARMRVAERMFTPQQVAELNALDGVARDERFCEFWVLREAQIKARGGSVLEDVEIDTDSPHLLDAPDGYRAALAAC